MKKLHITKKRSNTKSKNTYAIKTHTATDARVIEDKIFTPRADDNPSVNKNILCANVKCTGTRIVIGIDEAGRGPVLGYLVYAALLVNEDDATSTSDCVSVRTDEARVGTEVGPEETGVGTDEIRVRTKIKGTETSVETETRVTTETSVETETGAGTEIKGNETKGNKTKGNKTKGNKTKGNETKGNETSVGAEIKGTKTRARTEVKGTETGVGAEIKGNETKGNEIKGNETRVGTETKTRLTKEPNVTKAITTMSTHKETIKMCDSKQLLPKQRESIYEQIITTHSYVWYALHPQYISTEMDRRNLNDISISAVIHILTTILNALDQPNSNTKPPHKDNQTRAAHTITKVYVDALGSTNKYEHILRQHFPHIPFVVEHKADSTYRCVGGASIVAKVVRDDLLRRFSVQCGSGYPSDWRTVGWLSTNRESEMVRFKWAGVKREQESRTSARVHGKYDTLHFCDY